MAQSIKHWTLDYVYHRMRLQADQWLHPENPWLTRHAVQLLDQLLRPNDVGFEWGSGRSTVWFARRTEHLTSIENNPIWYERVKQMLAQEELENVSYEFRETVQFVEALGEGSSYVQAISQFPDRSVDYILVDGWARDWCCLAGISKLQTGGLLVLDNANWFLPPLHSYAPNSRSIQDGPANVRWEQFWQSVHPWRKIWTSNGITDTLILLKQ